MIVEVVVEIVETEGEAVDSEGIVETRTEEMIEEEEEEGVQAEHAIIVIDLAIWQGIVLRVTVEEIAEEVVVDSVAEAAAVMAVAAMAVVAIAVAGEAVAEVVTIATVKDTWQETAPRVTEEIEEEDNSLMN